MTASTTPTSHANEAELLPLIARLVVSPEHQDNPLRAPLEKLLEHCEGQRERLERLVRISDGYHSISRHQSLTLAEQYDKQLRRLEKLARISDRYQNSLRELSEALKVSALQDPLTGLDNRRSLMEQLREESERATRKNQPYGLAILDVDRFKLINDRFGHDAGDKALCAISDAIRKTYFPNIDLLPGSMDVIEFEYETALSFRTPDSSKPFHGRLVILISLFLLALLAVLPPLPAEDNRKAKGHAAQQADAIAPQPAADAFALFVLVEQIINRHALSCPV